MKRVYKPNLVPRFHVVAIIHLGRALPHGSSGLPGNAAGSLRTPERAAQFSFPYLALHREEFTWPQLLPTTPVSSYLTVSPITLSGWYILCCTCRHPLSRVPGRYPARCPMVFGLSSFTFVKAITRRASLQGWKSITKSVEHSNRLFQRGLVCDLDHVANRK